MIKVDDIIQQKKISEYHLLLQDAGKYGFIGTLDSTEIMNRHILESLIPLFFWKKEFSQIETVSDLGSGAGLPGIPLAISFPSVKFFLIEVMDKRARFLEKCSLKLGLKNVEIINSSVENTNIKSDLVTFRAFRQPIAAFELSLFLLKENGKVLYFRNKPMFSETTAPLGELRISELGFTYYSKTEEHPITKKPVGFIIADKNLKSTAGFPRKYYKIKKDPLFKKV